MKKVTNLKLHEEFKLYENMWESKTKQPKRPLTKTRSVADIEAEIARLQQELADAKVAEAAISTDKYYYIVCLLNTTRGKKVLDAGVHRLYSDDVDHYNKKGYDLAELAMTDFWDASGIAYRSTWTDAKWDELERYVYEIDEATYKNRRTLPQTDKEILKYVEDSVADYKE